MPFTVADVITEARDRNAAFDPKIASDVVLLRHLNSVVKMLYVKVLRCNRGVLAETLEVVPATVDFAAGVTLPANLDVVGVVATLTNGCKEPLVIMSSGLLGAHARFPCVWVEGFDTLMLSMQQADWAGIVSLTVQYVPAATTLTMVSDVVALPDVARAALVDALVWFLSARAVGKENFPVSLVKLYGEMAAAAESDFMDAIGARRVGKVFQVQSSY